MKRFPALYIMGDDLVGSDPNLAKDLNSIQPDKNLPSIAPFKKVRS